MCSNYWPECLKSEQGLRQFSKKQFQGGCKHIAVIGTQVCIHQLFICEVLKAKVHNI